MQAGSHSHRHNPSGQGHTRDAAGSLRLALAITATVMVVEFIGGIYSNSLALLADAGHMLTDVAALSLSSFAIWFASKPATPQKTYGFYRGEILVALLNGVFLVLVALWVFYETYQRLLAPPAVRADLMLLVASGGLAANLASAYILSGRLRYEFPDHEVEIGTGDIVHIPAGHDHRHRPHVLGDKPVKYFITEFS